MQLSPYRVQLAGIRTAPVEYKPAVCEAVLAGVFRDDGYVICRVSNRERSFVVTGQEAEISTNERKGTSSLRGKVSSVDVNPRESGTTAVIRLETSTHAFSPGMQILATVRRPVAEFEPFRSLPSNPPPLVKGDVLAVYRCPQHPDVLEVERGRCPIDRNDSLQRQGLLENQRIGWWCPMHPNVTAEHAQSSCNNCGGKKLTPRIITYRPSDQVLTVPESAVVDTGTHAVVFVERMPGMFDSVEVVVGPRCGDVYPVVNGLEPGQRVVTIGAFLLDAETRLNPSLAASYFGAGRATRNSQSDSTNDKSIVSEQGICPVTKKPLGSMGPPVSVTVNGRKMQLCCEACEERLRESPDKYLSKPKTP